MDFPVKRYFRVKKYHIYVQNKTLFYIGYVFKKARLRISTLGAGILKNCGTNGIKNLQLIDNCLMCLF